LATIETKVINATGQSSSENGRKAPRLVFAHIGRRRIRAIDRGELPPYGL